ncbi:hypothetical protein K469DRAFT_714745 [Zopfia rhizophila CBS 207.26]|uniref:Uncharacterized protein n=1 Tax=Zopfia rhizophila CBS 207.26 TaxID=1314779 RepID=A0A6A6DMZ7_9PEZI|nr:hypothetical protein K469DRAFT_714745 [Zopfia rhizophila CBS 207.26]
MAGNDPTRKSVRIRRPTSNIDAPNEREIQTPASSRGRNSNRGGGRGGRASRGRGAPTSAAPPQRKQKHPAPTGPFTSTLKRWGTGLAAQMLKAEAEIAWLKRQKAMRDRLAGGDEDTVEDEEDEGDEEDSRTG